jgi:hypothetical protein
MFSAAATHIAEGLSFKTVLTLKGETCLMCLVGTWRPTVYIIEL